MTITEIRNLSNKEADKLLHESKFIGGHFHENGEKYCSNCGISDVAKYKECCDQCGELLGYQCKHCEEYITEWQEWCTFMYCNSFDAAISVVKKLNEKDFDKFTECFNFTGDWHCMNYIFNHAKPRDFINALLKTIGV